MGNAILRLFLGIFGMAYGVRVLIRVWKRHRRVDTESLAVFKSAQDLGRDAGRKVYAIRYDVQSSDPFELLVTPCTKVPKSGAQRTIFYEKANPNANHYFKSIGTFDRRFLAPFFLVLCALVVFIVSIVEVI